MGVNEDRITRSHRISKKLDGMIDWLIDWNIYLLNLPTCLAHVLGTVQDGRDSSEEKIDTWTYF